MRVPEDAGIPEASWTGLFVIGGVAAMLAGLVFRRNWGPEASLLTGRTPPVGAAEWFALLQENRLLGLVMLNFFDVVDYALVGLMFLALCAALWRHNKSYVAIAAVLGFTGIAVFFASNTALSMLTLSDQYAAATTDTQRSLLQAAGQAVLAFDNPGVISPGTGIYMSFLLIGAAGLAFSVVMLRSAAFGRITAYVGILAGALDLAFCVLVVFAPWTGVFLVASAGLLLMVWHILVGLKLVQMVKRAPAAGTSGRSPDQISDRGRGTI